MNSFPISISTSRGFTALCTLLMMGFSTAQAQTSPASPTSGKRRNGHPTPAAPQVMADPAFAAAAPASGTMPARPAPTSPSDTELSPPTDKPGDPEAAPATTETEILASVGASFASKDRIAIFTGDVRVHDPKFQLASDKLTVFLNKSGGDKTAPAASGAATPPPLAAAGAPAPSPGAKPSGGGGIDHAIAEGHVIIIQERAAAAGGEAKRSVGRADWASFDNKSGDMTLKGTPSVEQNGNTHIATSPETVMVLRRDNSLVTTGPSRTVITQKKGATEMPFGGAATPAAGRPGATR